MSSFWNMSFEFQLPIACHSIIFNHFVVEVASTSTSEKNKTVKINGLVTMFEIEHLTEWTYLVEARGFYNTFSKSSNAVQPPEYKVNAVSSNGIAIGCFPTSMSFNVVYKQNLKEVDIDDNRLWKAHIVLSYDKLQKN